MKIQLSSFQKDILKLLDTERAVSTKMLIQATKKAPVVVSRNLSRLVQAGVLVVHGRGAGTYYTRSIGATLAEIDKLKTELDSFRPLPEPMVENIQKNLETRFIYATRTIEGAELPLRETALVLAGLSVKGKRDEIEDVKHQKKAFDLVSDFVHSDQTISETFIKQLQKLVTSNTVDVFLSGKYRDHEASISGTNKLFPSPTEVQKRMAEFIAKIKWMEEKKEHPVLIAVYAHYTLLAIHPFADGNGRTARLLMNAILLKHHYPITVIEASLRHKYYEVLRKADEGNFELFEVFIFEAIKKSLEFYLGFLRT